jgi:hypothetical protein
MRNADLLTDASKMKVKKRWLATQVELARIKQDEASARRHDRRNDAAMIVAAALTLLTVMAAPGTVSLLLALLWLRAAVRLHCNLRDTGWVGLIHYHRTGTVSVHKAVPRVSLGKPADALLLSRRSGNQGLEAGLRR